MKQQFTAVAGLAVPLALLALGTAPAWGDDHDKKTDVTIAEAVQVPGGIVLSPGTYMFILNNSSSTRNIVEIKSEDGKHLYAMTFTARATHVEQKGHPILTFYEMPAGQPPALRQWFWPGDYDGQEFLYPSSEAAKISKVSNQKVPEVSDQEYSKFSDQGFSTAYPANSSDPTAPAPVTGAPGVADPGVHGQQGQDLPPSR